MPVIGLYGDTLNVFPVLKGGEDVNDAEALLATAASWTVSSTWRSPANQGWRKPRRATLCAASSICTSPASGGPRKEERDLFIPASKSAALIYDNLSSIPEWISDVLCVVTTGGTFAARALRPGANEALFTLERPVAITSVGEIISRSDLADRAVLVSLELIPETERMTKAAFVSALELARLAFSAPCSMACPAAFALGEPAWGCRPGSWR